MAKEFDPKVKKLKQQCEGFHDEIAKEAGCSIATVYQVLNQVWRNKEVIEAAIRVRDRKAEEWKQVTSKI